jgi:hypothetical protein
MRRERLKDQIEDPRVSVFDSFVRAIVVLISMGAVYYALSGRGFPNPGPAVGARVTGAAPRVELVLTATRDHGFYWNKAGPYPVSEAASHLKEELKNGPVGRIIIAADESALLADAVSLYQQARRIGVSNVQLESHTRATP